MIALNTVTSNARASDSQLRSIYMGAWREDPGKIEIQLDEFPALLGNLLRDGGAGVLWPRIRHRRSEYGAVGEIIERTYNQYADNLNEFRSQLVTLLSSMSEAGIEAVLVKGWSISSRYAAPQIRRPGDIDIIVPTEQHKKAQEIACRLRKEGATFSVDLYSDEEWIAKGTCPSSDFRQHLQYVDCEGIRVPTLGSADALRHVCVHAIHHLQEFLGSTFPIWLCDIGVLIENPTTEIDWDRVLGSDDSQTQQVSIAIALARDLVGLNPGYLPPCLQTFYLPDWAISSVQERWAEPIWSVGRAVDQRGVVGAIRGLWPSKLNAALNCNISLDRRYYLPYQLWTFVRRMTWYLGYELPRNVMARRNASANRA